MSSLIDMESKKTDIKNMSHRQPFTVPDGYFDTLSSKIQGRISEESSRKPATAIKGLLAFAGGFAALVLIGYTGYYFAARGTVGIPVSNQEYFIDHTMLSDQILLYDDSEYYYDDSTYMDTFDDEAEEYLIAYGFEYSDIQSFDN